MDILPGLFFAVVFIVGLIWHIKRTPEDKE
jgi:flagellar biogenesis protein FliO